MDDYIELSFNIFDLPRQHAGVRCNLTVSALIDEILREFDDLEKDKPGGYALYLKGSDKPLDCVRTIVQLDLRPDDELTLKYAQGGGRAQSKLEQKAWLEEVEGGRRHEILWQPAVIGRPSADDPAHNQVLAVNLKAARDGVRVSRRHAQVTFEKGDFYLEPLSGDNLTYLNDDPKPLSGRRELHSGDRVFLSQARVALLFKCDIPKTSTDPALPVVVLVCSKAPDTSLTGKTFPIQRVPFILGRADCDVVIDWPGLSRNHARIAFNAHSGRYTLEDLESKNGVWLGDERLPPCKPVDLSPGASFRLGVEVTFTLQKADGTQS
jgi:pSer/pThr/pTyr-binding forkhead associated (FHA) protein